MSHIIIKRWEPTRDFSRAAIEQAATETRLADQQDGKQSAPHQTWPTINPTEGDRP